jgi:hypothetical protein
MTTFRFSNAFGFTRSAPGFTGEAGPYG